MNTRIDVSVIIVNYNSAAFTKQCLLTIFASTDQVSVEVIVVDNASYDGCDETIRAEFPEAIFIQSDCNLGFAGANNLGIRAAKGRYILFLNPDTEIRDSAIQRLLASLESMPDAGMVGGRLLNSDLSVQTTSITAFPSILNQVLGTEYLRQRFPHARLWGIGPLFEDHAIPVQVDAISGACMLAKREVVDQVRGFTADYFMYAEDLDLCLKIKKAGWNVYYVPDAVVIHHGGRSSTSRVETAYAAIMIRESMFRFMQRHRGLWYAVLFRVSTTLVAACRLILLTLLLPASLSLAWRRSLVRGWSKWSRILAWCVGLQNWASHQRLSSQPVSGAVNVPELP
jgi:N-acetylglucosaminyl-diphospho-decaprenol L-rhamnosyltransferase